MGMLYGREAKAAGAYLNDIHHYRQVRRRFREVCETMDTPYLLSVVSNLPLEKSEKRYLARRVVDCIM